MLGSCNGIFDMALYSLGKEVVEGIVKMKLQFTAVFFAG